MSRAIQLVHSFSNAVTNSAFLALQFSQGTKTACEDDSGILGRLKKVFYPEDEVDDDKDKRQQGKA